MGELTSLMVKPQFAGASSPVTRWKVVSCLVQSLPQHFTLRTQGATLHTSNTAKSSGIIEVLSFFGPTGPVAGDSQACIVHDSKHAVHGNDSVMHDRSFGIDQAQLKLRINMQQIQNHWQNVVSVCAENAAAPSNLASSRWVHCSFDSVILCDACGNLDEPLQVLRDARIAHMFASQFDVGRKRCVSCRVLLRCVVCYVLFFFLMCRYMMTCCFWLSRRKCLFLLEYFGWQWVIRKPRPRSPLRIPINLTNGHLGSHIGLVCHAHIGVSMEALFGEEDWGKIALSCHFVLDVM